MSDHSSYARKRRYSGGRTRGGGGIGFVPVVLMVIIAVVAWKYHAGGLPSLGHVGGFFGH